MRISHTSTFFGALRLSVFALMSLFFAQAAQAQGGAIPQFLPSSPWVVGDTGLSKTRGLRNIKLPCVMVNQFNNGFVVRLSGGNRKILAMAIDFRQDVFRQGARYEANLSIDGALRGSAKGSAFSRSILVFNMRDVRGFYGAIERGQLMGIAIGDNKMAFSLNNIDEGLRLLEACYSSGARAPEAKMQEASISAAPMMRESKNPEGIPLGAPSFEPPPTSLSEITSAAPARHRGIRKSSAVSSQGGRHMGAGEKVWSARAGESLKAVLSRWASTAGTQIKWQASGGGQVVADFTQSSSFEDAVSALIAQNAATSGLQGHMQSGAQTKALRASSMPISVTPAPRFPPQSLKNGRSSGGGPQWNAQQGSSLRAVLKQWSERSNVQLLWYAQHGYAVKSAVSQNGSFESALQAILEPYSADLDRPAVQFNTDPSTGKKVLIVETSRIF